MGHRKRSDRQRKTTSHRAASKAAAPRTAAQSRRLKHQVLQRAPAVTLIADDSRSQPTVRAPIPSYVFRETAVSWLRALEKVAAVGDYKRLSYDLLDLAPGDHVLDVGCGRGDDARAIAALIGPSGAVVGVDVDPQMIAAAIAARTGDKTTAAPIEFHIARAEGLPFADASFDAVRMDRVLQHLEDPEGALGEMHRVLRPRGRVVVVEPDWKMMAVYPGSAQGGDDDSLFAAILAWQGSHVRHPLAGRQLRALLREAGFDNVVYPMAYASTSYALADLVLELSAVVDAATAEADPPFSRVEAQRWIAAARAAEADNRFFASMSLFFARGEKVAFPARSE